MSEVNLTNVTMGTMLYSFLERKPKNYDVTFSVGPQKTMVKALKVILISSSPVFEREFEKKWDQAIVKKGEGIPLPDLDPTTFKLFIKLLICDTWSVEAVQDLNLSVNQLLNLISICRKYEIKTACNNLRIALQELFKNIGTFLNTNNFLELSKENLETILEHEDLMPLKEAEIFDYVCKWAKFQCSKNNMEPTGTNFRDVLGSCFYLIRFPCMTVCEFAKVRKTKGIFTAEETVAIYDYIEMGEDEKRNFDSNKFKFKTKCRKVNRPIPYSTISLTQLFKVVDTPEFICNGTVQHNYFSFNHEMILYGFGFLGPKNTSSVFEVSVEIRRRIARDDSTVVGKSEQRISAQKDKIFHFILDEPITLNAIPYDYWNNCYRVDFTLKGQNTRAIDSDFNTYKVIDDNNEFCISWGGRQILEIFYRTCL